VVEQVREAEMVQAVDRLRLIHSPREKTVVILCNIPLDLPVDELVTWRELAGDDRLEEAPALCEENGWDALPLAPEKLSELTAQKGTTNRSTSVGNQKFESISPAQSLLRTCFATVNLSGRGLHGAGFTSSCFQLLIIVG
jgi:hypothetical protein